MLNLDVDPLLKNNRSTKTNMWARHCCISIIFCCVMIFTFYGHFVKSNFISELNIQETEPNFVDPVQWTFNCENNKCLRRRLTLDEEKNSLESCEMLCPDTPSLWPKPSFITVVMKNSSTFNKNHIFLNIISPEDVKGLLENATNILIENISNENNRPIEQGDNKMLNIIINVSTSETSLQLSTNESYVLSTRNANGLIVANISAENYFGARHALETLSQIIWFDTAVEKLRILHDVQVIDQPMFSHRGLSIDTSRNFFPIHLLKKVVDGMASTKLNVLHLHLTDAVSFPIILPHNKKFAEYGAYSPSMTYSPEDIKHLVEYAKIQGVRTILEIDSPSHVNEGWNDNLVICGEDNVLNGHLNPDNPETLNVLQSIYEDLLELGSDKNNFHVGGDEVNLTCWANTKSAENFNNLHNLWVDFTNKIFDKVKAANNNTLPENIILWSSPLTDGYIESLHYKENIVVQYWFGSFDHILSGGYKIIFSTVGQWYLDCGFGPWKPGQHNGVCDPYTPWQKFYKYRPWQSYPNFHNQVLGGEACLWSEQISENDLETRLWPRAAAFAERVWSDPDRFDEYDVLARLARHSKRLEARGIKTAAMWPRWCNINPGKC